MQEMGYELDPCFFCSNKCAGFQKRGSDGEFRDCCQTCVRKGIDETTEQKVPRVKVPPAPKSKAPAVEFSL
jgi:hypothetical protein